MGSETEEQPRKDTVLKTGRRAPRGSALPQLPGSRAPCPALFLEAWHQPAGALTSGPGAASFSARSVPEPRVLPSTRTSPENQSDGRHTHHPLPLAGPWHCLQRAGGTARQGGPCLRMQELFYKKRLCQHLLHGRPVDTETKSVYCEHCLDRDDWGFDQVRDLNTP